MTRGSIHPPSLLFVFITLALSPSTRSQVTLELGGGGGLILPSGDYGGTTLDYYAGTKHGTSTGLAGHAKVRFGLLGARVTGELVYAKLRNSGNAEPGQGTIEISQTIIAFRLGPEFQFNLTEIPATPYFGVHFALNNLGGDVTFRGVQNIPDNNYIIRSASRVGVGFSGGALFRLTSTSTLDVAVTYSIMNPFSKVWEDRSPDVDQRLDSYLALNDDKDPLYAPNDNKHFIQNARSINTIQLTISVLFAI